jgi:tetratricopeptide (TPR) repeat protein
MIPVLRTWLLAAALGSAWLTAGETPPVPQEVATVLTAAAATNDVAARLAVLQGYKGAEHALVQAALGSALLDLQRDSEAQAAFTAAVALDPHLVTAHLGLARIAAAAKDWPAAVREMGSAVDLTRPERSTLAFYAECAVQAEDWRLADTLCTVGMARFPDERTFRRIDLALLIRSGQREAAHSALLSLLASEPTDPELWRNLAWSLQNPNAEIAPDLLAALELAALSRPADGALARQLADARMAAHLPDSAWAIYRDLAVGSDDAGLLTAAARAAGAAGQPDAGWHLLQRIPEAQRTREQQVLVARLAVQSGHPDRALATLAALISLGERDPQILGWAGQLAERTHEPARAEAFYQQALAANDDDPKSAVQQVSANTLRLAALYVGQGRDSEAITCLATHLARHPDDAQAQDLLNRVRQRHDAPQRRKERGHNR